MENELSRSKRERGVKVPTGIWRRSRVDRALRNMGFNGPGYGYYEIDHIVSVVEGGGCCGPENLRLLCTPCHRIETKELAARRAKKKRIAKGLHEQTELAL